MPPAAPPRAVWIVAAALYFFLAACAPPPAFFDASPLDISQDPFQETLSGSASFEVNRGFYRFRVFPLADYTLRGVVLGLERYTSGPSAALAPYDLAVAWGPMAEKDLYKEPRWSQSNRWYWWQYGAGFRHDNTFVARYTSNTHVIPDSSYLRRAVRSLGHGDVVELSGQLVRVERVGRSDSFRWKSSISRGDRDQGSCELLYLRRLKVDDRVYQ